MNGKSAWPAILVVSAAYIVVTWGYCLLKGWNVTLLAWINPLNPFEWPADGSPPLCIPAGQLWPRAGTGVPCAGGSGPTATQEEAASQEGITRINKETHGRF